MGAIRLISAPFFLYLVTTKNLHIHFLLIKTDQRGTSMILYMQSFTLTLASSEDTHKDLCPTLLVSWVPPSYCVKDRLLPLILFSGKEVKSMAMVHTSLSPGLGFKLFMCMGSASWIHFTIIGSELELGSYCYLAYTCLYHLAL